MNYFLDTEFNENGRTIDLISLALVCEDGREYYREVVPGPHPPDCNEWVRNNVLPHLWRTPDVLLSRWLIAAELLPFTARGDEKPTFWGYYADYDWVAICQLFGPMIAVPDFWPKYCLDLKQLCVHKGNPRLPPQEGTEHHALSDARWNREVHRFLTGTLDLRDIWTI